MRTFMLALAVGFGSLGPLPAVASVTLQDNYWGGNDHGWSDSIGGGHFNVSSAVITRPTANSLQIVINTDYAGHAGELGTGYGALFLTPGADVWNPTGTASTHWITDQYIPGQWQYALTMPGNPGQATNGTSGLYTVKESGIVMAHAANPNWTYRNGQAVQYNAGNEAALRDGTWSIGSDSITFNIVDNGLLGSSFALSWAMDCGNDVIQGQVNGVAAVPEASTWAMMMLGFAGVAAYGTRRRSSKSSIQT